MLFVEKSLCLAKKNIKIAFHIACVCAHAREREWCKVSSHSIDAYVFFISSCLVGKTLEKRIFGVYRCMVILVNVGESRREKKYIENVRDFLLRQTHAECNALHSHAISHCKYTHITFVHFTTTSAKRRLRQQKKVWWRGRVSEILGSRVAKVAILSSYSYALFGYIQLFSYSVALKL